ncbi:wall-associated receptor kinase 17-like [Rosa rugosa]|uniref:wall-associated receptor kinase 17-like n=1 Tax=Rosa rugosa TaxID=74645 RepID=UPI002B413E34|nr:wall-associated receptor kinase 17-like [Rosa rugosa]
MLSRCTLASLFLLTGIALEANTMLSYQEDCGDLNITLPYQNDFEVAKLSSTHLSDLTILDTPNKVTVIGCEYSFDFVRGTNKAPPNNNTNNSLTHASCSSSIGCCSSSIQTIPRGFRSFFTMEEMSITGNTKPFSSEAENLLKLGTVRKPEAYDGISKTRRELYHIKNGKDSIPYISVFPVNLILGLGSCCSILLFVISGVYSSVKNLRFIKLKTNFFKKNGGILLEQHIASHGDGMTTIFTAEQLEMATNCYQRILRDKVVEGQVRSFINEIIALAQMNHENLVNHSNGKVTLPWNILLKIASESAAALAYIHSSAGVHSKHIIHGNVKSSNILLTDNFTAKVSGFWPSRLVPANESQMGTLLLRTLGYMDPGYLCIGQLTDKSDVYSFGVVLVEILTREKPISFDRPESQRIIASHFVSSIELKDGFFHVVDPQVLNEGNREQVRAVAELAK